jgi:hypothetical protein
MNWESMVALSADKIVCRILCPVPFHGPLSNAAEATNTEAIGRTIARFSILRPINGKHRDDKNERIGNLNTSDLEW